MNKKGLGRGLGSLFADYNEEDFVENMDKKDKSASAKKEEPKVVEKVVEKIVEVEKVVNKPQEIAIALVDRNENQPRKKFDEKALQELASSIKEHGIIQPLVLNKQGERYMIIAGERRFRAAKLAGLKTVPAIVKEYNDKEVREVSIVENLQREDLNPIESAKAIKELIDIYKLTQETVAERIGKSRPAVANTLRLLTLPAEIIAMIENNVLSAGHARALLGVVDKNVQIDLAKLASSKKISVRELEKYIKMYHKKGEIQKQKPEQSLELKAFIKSMQDKFSTKVSVLGNDKKGRIYIDYYTSDDLDRIYKLIEKL